MYCIGHAEGNLFGAILFQLLLILIMCLCPPAEAGRGSAEWPVTRIAGRVASGVACDTNSR